MANDKLPGIGAIAAAAGYQVPSEKAEAGHCDELIIGGVYTRAFNIGESTTYAVPDPPAPAGDKPSDLGLQEQLEDARMVALLRRAKIESLEAELSSLRTAHAAEIAAHAATTSRSDEWLDAWGASQQRESALKVKLNGLAEEHKAALESVRQAKLTCSMINAGRDREYWIWANDGNDHLDSMGNQMAVLIRAEHLRAFQTAEIAAKDAEIERLTKKSQPRPIRLVRNLEAECTATDPGEKWLYVTMQLMNDLTASIPGKSFDPDWFQLRQRLEYAVTWKHDLEAAHAELAKVRAEKDEAIATREDSRVAFDTVRIERDKLRGELEEAREKVAVTDEASRRLHAMSLAFGNLAPGGTWLRTAMENIWQSTVGDGGDGEPWVSGARAQIRDLGMWEGPRVYEARIASLESELAALRSAPAAPQVADSSPAEPVPEKPDTRFEIMDGRGRRFMVRGETATAFFGPDTSERDDYYWKSDGWRRVEPSGKAGGE